MVKGFKLKWFESVEGEATGRKKVKNSAKESSSRYWDFYFSTTLYRPSSEANRQFYISLVPAIKVNALAGSDNGGKEGWPLFRASLSPSVPLYVKTRETRDLTQRK